MTPLKDFFEAERKRVVKPDAFFTQRTMARLDARRMEDTPFGIWEVVPGSARPVLALALVLILCFVVVEVFIPQVPQRGMVESILEPEQNPAESFLYSDPDVPARQVVLQQLISPEEQ